MSAITLQNVLDASSYYLGESGTPSNELTRRTEFANEAKEDIRQMRNWSWEKTYITTNLTASTISYALPAAMKGRTGMEWVKILDSSSNPTFLQSVTELQWNQITNNSQQDNVYFVKGNPVDGYTLNINPSPSATVTNGLLYCYYAQEADFAATTDTTKIPDKTSIAWYIAAKVLYGYREQAQYQLAVQEYQSALQDVAQQDMKEDPYVGQKIMTFREYMGKSSNFKTYY